MFLVSYWFIGHCCLILDHGFTRSCCWFRLDHEAITSTVLLVAGHVTLWGYNPNGLLDYHRTINGNESLLSIEDDEWSDLYKLCKSSQYEPAKIFDYLTTIIRDYQRLLIISLPDNVSSLYLTTCRLFTWQRVVSLPDNVSSLVVLTSLKTWMCVCLSVCVRTCVLLRVCMLMFAFVCLYSVCYSCEV